MADYDGNAELGAVAWLLQNPEAFERFTDLDEDCFSYRPARLVFSILSSEWERHEETPTLDEAVWLLKRFGSQLGEPSAIISKAVEDAESVYHGTITASSGEILRRIVAEATIRKISEELDGEPGEQILDRVDDIRSRLEALQRVNEDENRVLYPFCEDILRDPVSYVNELYGGSYIPMGIDRLDTDMDGGILPGEVACVMAPFGTGKTLLLLHIAFVAMQMGKRIFYVALDNLEPEMLKRIFARATGEKMGLHQESSVWGNKIREAVGGPTLRFAIKKMAPRRSTVGTIERIMDANYKKWREYDLRHGVSEARAGIPDICLIDYPDKLGASSKIDVHRLGLLHIYQEISGMSSDRKMISWVASQVNREGYEKAIQRAKFVAEASAKLEETHHVFALGRTPQDMQSGHGRLACIKARRDGVVHKIYPLFISDKTGIVRDNKNLPVEYMRGAQNFQDNNSAPDPGIPRSSGIAQRLAAARVGRG